MTLCQCANALIHVLGKNDFREDRQLFALKKRVHRRAQALDAGGKGLQIAGDNLGRRDEAPSTFHPGRILNQRHVPLRTAGQDQERRTPVLGVRRHPAELLQGPHRQGILKAPAGVAERRAKHPAAQEDVDPGYNKNRYQGRQGIDQNHHGQTGDKSEQGGGPVIESESRPERGIRTEGFDKGRKVDHPVSSQEKHCHNRRDNIEGGHRLAAAGYQDNSERHDQRQCKP